MVKKKILCVVGTRPEVIKMAPVILRLREEKNVQLSVVATSQHREILDHMLDLFQIHPNNDLNIMQVNQTLPQLTADLIVPFDKVLKGENPDLILAQGDTTTAFIASLVGFYNKIPYGHVEAGLRTGQSYNPFPEEMNRVLISRLSTLNFAPTNLAQENLIKEGLSKDKIHVTGNTVVDAMHYILKRNISLDGRIDLSKRLILVTAHRRENFGESLDHICDALVKIVTNNKDVQIFYPVHPNPNVRSIIYSRLGNDPRIILSEPLGYEQFLRLMKEAYLILSDSGGVQEEAPVFGTPVLVLRETTERQEACETGATRLVGTNMDDIVGWTQRLLDNKDEYNLMTGHICPYGDGKAAERITKIALDFLD